MQKFRPSHSCIYVIPEIHGNIESIKIIFNRIFPLRFSDGRQDQVILLGDYIDVGDNSSEVIDLLISYKQEYGEDFICLKGNHEVFLLNALKSEESYNSWLLHGGVATIKSYLFDKNSLSDPTSIPFSRLLDIIPPSHINFLNALPTHIVLDDYVLFHGGFDLLRSIEETSDYIWTSDTNTSRVIKKSILNNEQPLIDRKKVYVGAHNYNSKFPFIYQKYFMLGGGAPSKLIIFELNSMACAMIKNGRSRIYKHKIKYHE